MFDNMKFQKSSYHCAVGTVLTLGTVTPVIAADLSVSGLRTYLAAGATATEPGLLLALGASLVGLRILIGKRSKRRDKEGVN
jgi:hypothetical protein